MSSKVEQICQLNDAFRQSFLGGQVMITNGMDRLSPSAKLELFDVIKGYKAFTEDNDPHGEHDFGSLTFHGERYFWKIDYYDNDMLYHSPDPANPSLTKRALTIMTAEEY